MAGGDLAALNGGQPINTTEENTGGSNFDPIPAGWYPVEVQKSEIRTTKNGQGKFLWLQVVVIGEHYKGRTLFPKFNLVNASAKAVEIGQRDLGHLGQSVGMPTGVKDSEDLLGKQFDARVRIKPAEGDYPADNEIQGYAPLGTKSAETPKQAPSPKAAGKPTGQPRAWDKPPEQAAAPPTPPPVERQATTPTQNPAPVTAPAKGSRPWERKS